MITLQDLDAAIAECQGHRDPNAQTCIKLAAFYTIKREMFGEAEEPKQTPQEPGYSNAAANAPETYIEYDSGSEFSHAIDGLEAYPVWEIMDELLSVLQATNRRLYDGVLRKIESL